MGRFPHLLALEHVLVELLLQALVGQIDAQLLEAVLLERLKAIDVQDADRPPAQYMCTSMSIYHPCTHTTPNQRRCALMIA